MLFTMANHIKKREQWVRDGMKMGVHRPFVEKETSVEASEVSRGRVLIQLSQCKRRSVNLQAALNAIVQEDAVFA